jgi:oligopeptide/dipeptide ABC transporter ATP-binding protein
MRRIRGKAISMIFQDPMSSLNPVFKVGSQISGLLMLHRGLEKKEAFDEAVEMIRRVRIPDPEKVARQYPFELSGGMRQRVMIAMAISCNPDLLIADEPTTFLDVSVQAQTLKLMKEIRERIGASMLLITHDLGVAAQACDRMAVMYAGAIVEEAPVKELFKNPLHPYTQGLLECIPKLDEVKTRLAVVGGMVPSLIDPPSGCMFNPRCPFAWSKCGENIPTETDVGGRHLVKCFKFGR